MSTDKIGDMLTRIKNGYLAGKKTVNIPHSSLKEQIAKIMVSENYLDGVSVHKNDQGFSELVITLKYLKGTPVLTDIKRVSKPGLRVYRSALELKPVLSGLGISILSTPKGIMSGSEAKKQKIGGEVLCELY